VQTLAAIYWVSRGENWFGSAAGQQVPVLLSLCVVLAVAGLSRSQEQVGNAATPLLGASRESGAALGPVTEQHEVSVPPEHVPRWQAERDRLHRDTSPLLLWIYRQWWLHAATAIWLLGVGISAATGGEPASDYVPALVLGALFSGFALTAYRHRHR
jgi:hypothetical protein